MRAAMRPYKLYTKSGYKIIKSEKKIIIIRGIVIPVEWDEKGKVVAAALSTHTEDEYLIDHDYKGKQLLHCIQEEVEVSGVARLKKDKKIIKVQKYILKKMGPKGAFEKEGVER